MKSSVTQRLKESIGNTAARAAVGYKSGEYNSTRAMMNVSSETIGIIYSVMAVNKTVYAIAYRQTPTSDVIQHHPDQGIKQFYNCDGDVNKMSPYELLMPIYNINLSVHTIDPRTLVGQKLLVSEINGQAIKAELIGELAELNESPFTIPRNLLRSVRNYIGGYNTLHDKDERIQGIIQQFGLSDRVDKLYEFSVADLDGKLVTFENEAKYTSDVAGAKEGELIAKVEQGDLRHANQKTMKTKKCHLPVKLFSAR